MRHSSVFRACALLVLLTGAAAVSACSRAELSGPPDLRLGRDECGECGMIISEDRCSSASLVERHGRREYIMYDDIGCMLDYEHERGGRDFTVIDGFVRDYNTKQWSRAADATFLFAESDDLPTPMGSGIVAFATRASAEQKQQEVAGDILDYPGLAAARRQWMQDRYGKPAGDP